MAGKRSLSREEQALWRKVMGDVELFNPDAQPKAHSGETKTTKKPKKLPKQNETAQRASSSPPDTANLELV